PRYTGIAPDQLPASECLKDVVDRMLPYWHDRIVPDLQAGKVVLVAAHGNSLRALVKHLKGISDEAIAELDIPTGVPWVFRLDERDPCQPIDDSQLGDPAEVLRKAEAVKRQAG
ncbi:MAG: 2,3-bisphosphoglycerate-dependent phosphoglycerate mutase, partial [Acidimicrobiaceae bacterium]|nr:2,3-bisphosphoglycerate-dependent phosphoglycerate mutase [Acidimicrobiaceae bacterium]